MTSKEAKIALVEHLLYGHGRMMAMTEFRYADVFAVTRAFYTEEYEIKVEKGDLRRELEVVAWAAGFGDQKNFAWNKRHKHKRYFEAAGIRKAESTAWGIPSTEDVPNRFYFVVPDMEMEELAMRCLRSTPYGLIRLVEIPHGPWIRVDVVKEAINLHGKKESADKLLPHMRKVCTESLELMKKIGFWKKGDIHAEATETNVK